MDGKQENYCKVSQLEKKRGRAHLRCLIAGAKERGKFAKESSKQSTEHCHWGERTRVHGAYNKITTNDARLVLSK